jgi:catechol 2,3-dioxygenase-like lactoylglutathione lyase family enzyme
MAVQLNHTIVLARDNVESATFLAEMLGLKPPRPYGPFIEVATENGVSLDFMNAGDHITPQHYAFLISEDEFDDVFGRILERELPHWADPHQTQPNAINHHDGGRGVYFPDPNGHLLEVITRPYGSGS